MKTKYNLDLSVADNLSEMPLDIYALSVACFKKQGLTGEKHVDLIGRVFDGFDPSCPSILEGRFDVFYESGMDVPFREMLDQWELISSGFDEDAQEALALGKEVVEVLERLDPLSKLPWSMYRQFPLIQSQEINTPAGIQSLRAHLPNHDFIRFIRFPKGHELWDYDTLKDTLFRYNLSVRFLNDKGEELSFREKLKERIRMRYFDRSHRLYDSLFRNSDKIKQVPDFVKKLPALLEMHNLG